MYPQFNEQFTAATRQFADTAAQINRLALENAEKVFGLQLSASMQVAAAQAQPEHWDRTMLRIALFAAALCLGIHPALAAPAGLMNKTIHISYGFYIPGKSAVGTTNGGGRTESVILYISSAGRVFGIAAVVGAINSLLFAVAVTVGAFVYNVSADLVGGIEVTLSERD